jgi:hypothetical protein
MEHQNVFEINPYVIRMRENALHRRDISPTPSANQVPKQPVTREVRTSVIRSEHSRITAHPHRIINDIRKSRGERRLAFFHIGAIKCRIPDRREVDVLDQSNTITPMLKSQR